MRVTKNGLVTLAFGSWMQVMSNYLTQRIFGSWSERDKRPNMRLSWEPGLWLLGQAFQRQREKTRNEKIMASHRAEITFPFHERGSYFSFSLFYFYFLFSSRELTQSAGRICPRACSSNVLGHLGNK